MYNNKKDKERLYRPPFSPDEFKRWIDHQDEHQDNKSLAGAIVEAKINFKKLLEKIEPEENTDDEDVLRLAKSFKRLGGSVVEENGPDLTVEVDAGKFIISKVYVRRRD